MGEKEKKGTVWWANFFGVAFLVALCASSGVCLWWAVSGYNRSLVAEYAEKVRTMQFEYEQASDLCKPHLARVISLHPAHPAEVSISYLDEDLQQFLLQIRDLVSKERVINSPNNSNP